MPLAIGTSFVGTTYTVTRHYQGQNQMKIGIAVSLTKVIHGSMMDSADMVVESTTRIILCDQQYTRYLSSWMVLSKNSVINRQNILSERKTRGC